jgi:hypothetical protein
MREVVEERLASLRDVFAEDPRPAWEHVHALLSYRPEQALAIADAMTYRPR